MTINTAAVEREIDRLCERSPTHRADVAQAVWRNIRNWGESFREDPELAAIELRIAWCARIEQTEAEGSPQRAAAIREDRQLRDARLALLTARAEAKTSEAPF